VASTFRAFAAWLRERWHADLAFVDGHRHADILTRIEQVEQAQGQFAARQEAAIESALMEVRGDLRILAQTVRDLSQQLTTAHDADSRAAERAILADEASWRQLCDTVEHSINERFAQLTLRPTAPSDSPLDSHKLESKGVFVVGCARSGTTITADCLNLSPDVLVLEEAFLFVDHVRDDFVGMMNNRHVGYGNMRRKGTWISPSVGPESGGLACLKRLGRQYRFVGEKLAFGPPPNHLGDDWAEAFFQFQARHFHHSHYFLIARRPIEAVWSMHKMFPDCVIPKVIDTWLRALQLCLDMYLVFPNSYFMTLEDLDERTVARMAEVLGVEIDVPKGMLGRERQKTRYEGDRLPPVLNQYKPLLANCNEIYRHVRERACRETLRFSGCERADEFFEDVRDRVSTLAEGIAHLGDENVAA